MKNFSHITGIIAELNPLHKGHETLIRSQKKFGVCVVVLSSNFTQRGSPSFIDKFLRASMAIKAGADLVIELPFIFACSAAQDFSRGAVGMFARMKFITRLAFGMEDPEFNFMPLININNDEAYKKFLRVELKRGASFTKAHSIAAEKILPGSHDFLSKPNNLLAVSYISELIKNNSDITPVFIKREGIFRSRDVREKFEENFYMLPDFSREILLDAKNDGCICNEERLWPLLQSIFLRTSADGLQKIHGIDEGIENLFLRNWQAAHSLDDFIGRCVCARYTRSHIRRRLIYILLGLNRFEAAGALRNPAPYARVLAFNSTGRELLKTFSKSSDIKFITRLKDAEGRAGKFFAELEMKAGLLYEVLSDNPDMRRELHKVLKF